MFKISYRVKPIHSELNEVEIKIVYAVQKKSILSLWTWYTIKYFNIYKEANKWIDEEVFGK